MSHPRVVFLGTPDFAVPFLDALTRSVYRPYLVITQPDEPVGRKKIPQPSPVKQAALSLQLPVHQPTTKRQLQDVLRQAQPTVCILVAYGTIIPRATLSIPSFGFINAHPSLLPAYRGPSPVQQVLIDQQENTGISLMVLDEQMDHGPVLVQESVTILPDDTNVTLHQRLAARGAELLLEILPQYLGGILAPRQQDHGMATYTSIITRDNGLINWHLPARSIYAVFRAYTPWPGVFTYWRGKRLKITKLSFTDEVINPGSVTGRVIVSERGLLAVRCGVGQVIVGRLQLEGKNDMSAQDFARGYPEIIGSILGSKD